MVRAAIDDGQGVLITPNQPGHADAYAMFEAADRVGCPLYFMLACQVMLCCLQRLMVPSSRLEPPGWMRAVMPGVDEDLLAVGEWEEGVGGGDGAGGAWAGLFDGEAAGGVKLAEEEERGAREGSG